MKFAEILNKCAQIVDRVFRIGSQFMLACRVATGRHVRRAKCGQVFIWFRTRRDCKLFKCGTVDAHLDSATRRTCARWRADRRHTRTPLPL